MVDPPSIDEIQRIAREAGLDLNQREAEVLQGTISQLLPALSAFDSLPVPLESLPLRYSEGRTARRAAAEENPHNAFITRCEVRGASDGPLAEKTVGLKDQTAVAGVPMTLGSPFLQNYVPDFDATIATRLLDAGATIIGKMNMEPFSFGGGTAGPRGFGRVLNPHDHARSSGGSSSGSAAALAAGEIDLAVGGDQGGSVRIPAAWCGIVGLKATHGLIPHTGVFGSEASIDHVGPMTRTVGDMARMLACIAGPDPYDPRQRNVPPAPDYVDLLDRGVHGLRIGVLQEGFGAGEADVDDAVKAAVDVLSACGAVVQQVSWPMHNLALLASLPLFLDKGSILYDTNLAGPISGTWSPTSFITEVGRRMAERPGDVPLVLKFGIISGRFLHSRTHGWYASQSENMRRAFVNELDNVLETVDLLALPTVPIKAPVYESGDALELTLLGGEVPVMLVGRNTWPYNYTGHPAITLPCAKSNGLPVGLQLVGRRFAEETLLRAAYALQCSVDWDRLIAVQSARLP